VYEIVFTKQAIRQMQKMPRELRNLIHEKLDQIAADPFASHHNVTKLHNREGFRLGVGDWRVIYDLQKDKLVIMMLRVATRSEVYR
jgi:mRNA interferase RelE/StbE